MDTRKWSTHACLLRYSSSPLKFHHNLVEYIHRYIYTDSVYIPKSVRRLWPIHSLPDVYHYIFTFSHTLILYIHTYDLKASGLCSCFLSLAGAGVPASSRLHKLDQTRAWGLFLSVLFSYHKYPFNMCDPKNGGFRVVVDHRIFALAPHWVHIVSSNDHIPTYFSFRSGAFTSWRESYATRNHVEAIWSGKTSFVPSNFPSSKKAKSLPFTYLS
jgi:hypothetical protein